LSAYFYSKKYLREKLKEFIKVFLIIFIFSIPAIVIIILNLIVMHNQICSFSKDIYVFGKEIFYAILELFYSNDMYSVYEYNINNYRPIWNNLKNPDYFIFVAFPILIGVVGIIKSLLKNDKILYLFLIPSLMFLCVSFLLAKFGILAFLPKYSAIVFPIFVCSTCVGFTFFEKKYVSILLFLIIISINYVKSIDLYTKLSVEKFRYSTGYLSEFFKDKIKLQKNDLLLIPYSGNKIVRYAPPCKFIDFEADDMLLLKDKKSLKIYFGTDEPDKKNIKNFIRPYVIKDKPVESYEKFLEKYFNFMKKGDRFIFVEYRYECTEPFIQNWKMLQDENFYNKMNLFMLMMSKVTRDTFFVAQKHLVLENLYVDKKGEYIVFEYKKH